METMEEAGGYSCKVGHNDQQVGGIGVAGCTLAKLGGREAH